MLLCFHKLIRYVTIGITFSYVWVVPRSLWREKALQNSLFIPYAAIAGGAVTVLYCSSQLENTISATFCIQAHVTDDSCCKLCCYPVWLQSVDSRLKYSSTQVRIGVSSATSNKMGRWYLALFSSNKCDVPCNLAAFNYYFGKAYRTDKTPKTSTSEHRFRSHSELPSVQKICCSVGLLRFLHLMKIWSVVS